MVFSTFYETLIYVYPSDKNELLLDCTFLPVQILLFYDLINLNNPKYDLADHLVKILVPQDQAIKTYLETPTTMMCGGPGSAYISVKLRLINPYRLLQFEKNSFMTFYKKEIEVLRDKNDPLHTEIYKTDKPHNFKIPVNGALLITGEKDLSNLDGIAQQIGKTLAEYEIKKLITNSQDFRTALAHEELSKITQEILRKKKQSEDEQNPSLYPLWQYYKDVEHLMQKAKEIGVATSYIEDLLKDEALQPNSGRLFYYTSTLLGYMVQWILLNIILFLVLLVIKYKLIYLFQSLSQDSIQYMLLGIVTAANGWAFYGKPKPLNVVYWIVPGMLFLACAILILASTWSK